MIEPMKSVCVVTSESNKKSMIVKLRDLGILHIAGRSAAESELTERFTQLSKTSSALGEFADKNQPQAEILSDSEFIRTDGEINSLLKTRAGALSDRLTNIVEIDKIRNWGDFSPEALKGLAKAGYSFRFYLVSKKELERLRQSENITFLRLKSVDKQEAIAVLGETGEDISGSEFNLPQRGLSQLQADTEALDITARECEEKLKDLSKYLNSYQDQLLKLQNDMEMSSASRSASDDSGLVWLSGYIPAADADAFVSVAKENGWAWAMDDVIDDDGEVPTMVKYNRVTSLMKPVFSLLGTVPGYNEYDISFWFLCFFTLFVAMIIGDAAYGVIMLIITAAINLKTKKAGDGILLLYVLSIGTIIWGSLTGTWLGLEGAMKIPFLKALVIPQIANYPEYFGVTTTAAQNAVMKFSFSVGVIHLVLACIMNIKTKLRKKDLSMVADLGWLIAIVGLYVLVLYLVVGQSAKLGIVAAMVAAGFILVVMFGGMAPGKSFAEGLKSGLADAFTTFLNTISAFGNVMSYIRLFAVGMASLAIAQSFNGMAESFSGPLVIVGAAVMILGHVLNIVMAFLSVAVHGVRLNLLEFSGQLGMEWSGKEYDPLRRMNKIRK